MDGVAALQVLGGAGYTAGAGKGHRPQPAPRGAAGSLSQGAVAGKARGLPGSRGKLATGASPGKNHEQQQQALMRLHMGLPTSR